MQRVSYNVSGLAIVVASIVAINAAAAEIRLRDKMEATSPVVRLDDVAEISAADGLELQRLSRTLLMPAPAPGTQRFVRLREVQDMLAAQGEDLSRLQFSGASQVAVATPGATPEAAPRAATGGRIDRQAVMLAGQVKQPAAAAIEERKPLDEAQADILRGRLNELVVEYLTAKAGHREDWRVNCNVPDRTLELLDGAVSAPKCSGGEAPWTGRQRFVFTFSTSKGRVQLSVAADVGLAMRAVVAIRPIQKGGVITAAHVQLQTIDFMEHGDRGDPVDSVEKIIGMEARQAIKAGDTVFTNQVSPPLLVKRGEDITVLSRGGGIRVRTMARAVQDGARGDLVQVETLDKKDRYDARVTGTREVVVFSPTRPAAAHPQLERTETAWR